MPKLEGYYLCQCELTGDIHLLETGKGCELCLGGDEATHENINKALDYLAQRKPSAKCQICTDTGVVSTGSELDQCPFCDAGKKPSSKPVVPDDDGKRLEEPR